MDGFFNIRPPLCGNLSTDNPLCGNLSTDNPVIFVFNEVLEVIGGYKSYVTRMEEKEGKIDYFLVCLPKILLSILRK